MVDAMLRPPIDYVIPTPMDRCVIVLVGSQLLRDRSSALTAKMT